MMPKRKLHRLVCCVDVLRAIVKPSFQLIRMRHNNFFLLKCKRLIHWAHWCMLQARTYEWYIFFIQHCTNVMTHLLNSWHENKKRENKTTTTTTITTHRQTVSHFNCTVVNFDFISCRVLYYVMHCSAVYSFTWYSFALCGTIRSLLASATITKNLIVVIVDLLLLLLFRLLLSPSPSSVLLLSSSSSLIGSAKLFIMYCALHVRHSNGTLFEFPALFENLVIVELSHKQHECRQHLLGTICTSRSNFGMKQKEEKIIFRSISTSINRFWLICFLFSVLCWFCWLFSVNHYSIKFRCGNF